MRKVLFILGQLSDLDVAWLATTGARRMVEDGEVLIQQGVTTSHVFILLEGHVRVSVEGVGEIATSGAGEVLGEMSFVDKAPPAATVTARGHVKVLALARRDLEDKLARDDGFGHRFYRALAVFLADRLRDHHNRAAAHEAGGLREGEILRDELDENVLDRVSIAGDRFERLLRALSGTVG